ncbi:hypothetical protein FIBSPDRAFT_761919 [Athelia psychrophila]|uniref:Transmembrane protein n=1 Tax=Athelia psychrophila TaxID=1759441 RepID=A0A165X1N9_9AGAM|nr:hypothetical protein FIBSPDRAFT_761919 [Fibularhizoctonia sp. CBS 109695]
MDDTLGALEIGTFISMLLYGVTSMQVYIYYSHNTMNDPLRIRILVPFLWVIETFQTICTVYYIYSLTVTNFGNVASISAASWSLSISSLFDGLVGALVQTYFAHRIHVLSTTWTITIVSWIGSFLALIGSAAVLVLGLTNEIPEFEARYVWVSTTTLVLLVSVDLINMVALCTYLKISRTGHKRTDHIINKLFLWTIRAFICI